MGVGVDVGAVQEGLKGPLAEEDDAKCPQQTLNRRKVTPVSFETQRLPCNSRQSRVQTQT